METVSVSLDVLAAIIGKNGSELQSAVMTDKDGDKVPIDQKSIDKYVEEQIRGRLKGIRDEGKKEAYSAGKKAAFDEVEKHLEEGFGLSAGTTWKDGINNVVDSAKNKAATSEEIVKASEAYKKLAGQLQERDSELNKVKQDFRDRIIQDKFQREIEAVLADSTLGLALPSDSAIRENQLASFRSFLSSKGVLNYTEDGNLIPVDTAGKQLEDQNFNPVSIKSFIVGHAKQFWPTVSPDNGRQSPPAGQPHNTGATGQGDGQGSPQFPVFKTAEEFSAFLDNAMIEGKDAGYMEAALKSYESQS